jgi:hypothetical protein
VQGCKGTKVQRCKGAKDEKFQGVQVLISAFKMSILID